MNNTATERKLLFNTRIFVLLFFLLLNSLFALVLAPLYSRAASDIAFGFDYLPDILDAVILVVHLISFFFGYAVTIYSLFRFSFKKTVPTVIIIAAMTVYKYGMNLIAGWFIYDVIPTSSAELNLSIMSVVSNTALELLQYAVIICVSYAVIKRAMPAFELQKKQHEKLGNAEFEMRECVFPFSSVISKKNPLQKSALYSAVAVSCFKIVQLLIYDFVVGGTPSDPADVFWMIAYYAGTLILGAFGYLFMLLILMKLDESDLKLKNNTLSK